MFCFSLTEFRKAFKRNSKVAYLSVGLEAAMKVGCPADDDRLGLQSLPCARQGHELGLRNTEDAIQALFVGKEKKRGGILT